MNFKTLFKRLSKRLLKKRGRLSAKDIYELNVEQLKQNDIIVYMYAGDISRLDDIKEKCANFQSSWEYCGYEMPHPYEFGRWRYETCKIRLYLLPIKWDTDHGK